MGKISLRNYNRRLYAEYTHKGRRLKLSTEVLLDPQYLQKGELRKNTPNYNKIEQTLSIYYGQMLSWINKVVFQGREPTVANVKEIKEQEEAEAREQEKTENKKPGYPLFRNLFNDYLEYKAKRFTPRTARNIKHTAQVLKDFENEKGFRFDITTMTKKRFDDFVEYLFQRNLRNNTIEKHVRILRAFIHWAYPEKQHQFNFITYKYVPPNIHYLQEHELEKLIKAEISNPRLDKVRDLFIFLATTGMRYSDSQQFTPDWISSNVIEYNAIKTGNRTITYMGSTPTHVINKYDGAVPKMSAQKFNDYLKELFTKQGLTRKVTITEIQGGKKQQYTKPLNEIISSHMGRKTFITLCFLKEVPLKTIMDMVGTVKWESLRPYMAEARRHIQELDKYWDI